MLSVSPSLVHAETKCSPLQEIYYPRLLTKKCIEYLETALTQKKKFYLLYPHEVCVVELSLTMIKLRAEPPMQAYIGHL